MYVWVCVYIYIQFSQIKIYIGRCGEREIERWPISDVVGDNAESSCTRGKRLHFLFCFWNRQRSDFGTLLEKKKTNSNKNSNGLWSNIPYIASGSALKVSNYLTTFIKKLPQLGPLMLFTYQSICCGVGTLRPLSASFFRIISKAYLAKDILVTTLDREVELIWVSVVLQLESISLFFSETALVTWKIIIPSSK